MCSSPLPCMRSAGEMTQLFLSQAGVYFYHLFMQELPVLCLKSFLHDFKRKNGSKGRYSNGLWDRRWQMDKAAELVWKIMAW